MQNLNDSIIHAKLCFLLSVRPILQRFELIFQRESPQIHILYDEMIQVLRNTMAQFLKPALLQNMEKVSDIYKIDYKNIKNQLQDSDLAVGAYSRSILTQSKDGPRKLFYLSVRSFFTTLTSKLKAYLPLDNKLLMNMRFLRPESQPKSESLQSVRHVAYVMSKIDDTANIHLDTEWHLYASEDIGDIKNESDIEQFWCRIEMLCYPDEQQKFPSLCKLARLCLSLAHSNADTERTFAESRLIFTKQRKKLGIDMLNSLMVVKAALKQKNCNAQNMPITPRLLNYARNAYSSYSAKLEKSRLEEAKAQKKADMERRSKQIEQALAKERENEKQNNNVVEKEKSIETDKQESKQLMNEAEALLREYQMKVKEAQKKCKYAENTEKQLKQINENMQKKQLKRIANQPTMTNFLTKTPKLIGCSSGDTDQNACCILFNEGFEMPSGWELLVQCASILIQGDTSLASELRAKTSAELSEHAAKYARHSHIINKAAAMSCDVPTTFHTLLDKSFQSETQNARLCSMLHVFALSTVIGAPICNVFPDAENYAKPLYEGTVIPLRPNSSSGYSSRKSITIMWSKSCTEASDKKRPYIPDHVVPLVEK